MKLPAGLTPEAAAWLQMQMTLANARTAATLRAEISRVDDWANGVFAALRDVVLHQLQADPTMGKALAPGWREAAEGFDRIDVQGLPAAPDEPLEFLEARKMLYRLSVALRLMPEAEAVRIRKAA